MAREGVPLNVIQRQLGHADLGVTSVYLQGIDNTEVIRHRPVSPRAGDARERGRSSREPAARIDRESCRAWAAYAMG
jgi:hypothetical protein